MNVLKGKAHSLERLSIPSRDHLVTVFQQHHLEKNGFSAHNEGVLYYHPFYAEHGQSAAQNRIHCWHTKVDRISDLFESIFEPINVHVSNRKRKTFLPTLVWEKKRLVPGLELSIPLQNSVSFPPGIMLGLSLYFTIGSDLKEKSSPKCHI